MNHRAEILRNRLDLTPDREKDLVQAIKNKAKTEETSVFNVAYHVYFVCCLSKYPIDYDLIMKELAI